MLGLVWGVALLVADGYSWAELYHNAAIPVAWATIAAGIAARASRPQNRVGGLLVLLGFLTLVSALQATRTPAMFTAGSLLAEIATLVVVYVLLIYPRNRLRTVPERGVFAFASIGVAAATVSTFFYDPRDLGCVPCPPGMNLVLIDRDPEMLSALLRVAGVAGLIAASGVAVILALRSIRATRPARRIVLPMSLPALLIMVDAAIGVTMFWILQRPQTFPAWYVAIEFATRILLPLGMLFGLLRLRLRRSMVGELVMELGGASGPQRLRDAVARALGDPSADVAFWSEASGSYIRGDGRAAQLPGAGDDRATSFLERDGEPLAVIIHDAALRDDPRLLDAVAAAARLAVENERLEAEVRAQLEEVRRSRAHLVEATDAERRKVERDLHDGAQQRLVSLTLALRMAEQRARALGDAALVNELAGVSAGLDDAIDELRELARGIYPPALTQGGVAAAVEELAERSPIPVRVRVSGERLDSQVEASAYFVVAEALTNAAKHSFATQIGVGIRVVGEDLVVSVQDDGIGGANAGGSGLRGLAERVAALDGTLTTKSPPGRGTEVIATIPCASSLQTIQP